MSNASQAAPARPRRPRCRLCWRRGAANDVPEDTASSASSIKGYVLGASTLDFGFGDGGVAVGANPTPRPNTLYTDHGRHSFPPNLEHPSPVGSSKRHRREHSNRPDVPAGSTLPTVLATSSAPRGFRPLLSAMAARPKRCAVHLSSFGWHPCSFSNNDELDDLGVRRTFQRPWADRLR